MMADRLAVSSVWDAIGGWMTREKKINFKNLKKGGDKLWIL